jgi:hypothetical protein
VVSVPFGQSASATGEQCAGSRSDRAEFAIVYAERADDLAGLWLYCYGFAIGAAAVLIWHHFQRAR